MFETSRENHGYDGMRNGVKWWFAGWGSGPKSEWKRREVIGRPPTPRELRDSDYIIIAIQSGNAVRYVTHTGGLDIPA